MTLPGSEKATPLKPKVHSFKLSWTDGLESGVIENPSHATQMRVAQEMADTIRRQIFLDIDKMFAAIRKMKPGTTRRFKSQPVYITVCKEALNNGKEG